MLEPGRQRLVARVGAHHDVRRLGQLADAGHWDPVRQAGDGPKSAAVGAGHGDEQFVVVAPRDRGGEPTVKSGSRTPPLASLRSPKTTFARTT